MTKQKKIQLNYFLAVGDYSKRREEVWDFAIKLNAELVQNGPRKTVFLPI